MRQQIRTILLIALALPALTALAAEGLKLHLSDTRTGDPLGPRWQARFQLSSLDAKHLADSSSPVGSRVLSLNLLGDYYLTGSGISGVRGGMRATGGMLLGPLSLTQSSAGLALGSGTSGLNFGQRSVRLGNEFRDPAATVSYLGIGYTGHLLHSGLSFSADLGLVSNLSLGGLRLGNAPAPLDDVLRDLRYKPLLQLGLSYSY